MTVPALSATGSDKTLIGLISTGHFFSHYFILALPPLFPLLKQEFGVSYAVLGGITATYATCSALSQYPLGILADRFGARVFLIAGLGLISLAYMGMGTAGSIQGLYALSIVAGLADGVFHPCGYAILSARVGGEKSGRAFSIHTFGGFAGFGVAPLVVVPLAAYAGWQNALLFSGMAGLAVTALLLWHRDALHVENTGQEGLEQARPAAGSSNIRMVLTSGPLLLMFGFYVFSSAANTGLMNHIVSILTEGWGMAFGAAGSVLPVYLWGIIFGVLAGGFTADYFKRVDFTATAGTFIAAMIILATALLDLPLPVLFTAFLATGFGYGVVMPSRDIVVRSLAPPGGIGQAFGFVNTGYGVGGAVGPVLIGWVLDHGHSRMALALPSALLLASMAFTLTAIKKGANRPRALSDQAESPDR